MKLIFCEGHDNFEDIEIEGQTTQWSNEKGQKGKQWSTEQYTEN